MQEEITQKTLALCVEASKMTAQLLQQAMKKVLADMEKHKKNPQLRHGKQTLRQLMKHNTGVSNIEITDQNMPPDGLTMTIVDAAPDDAEFHIVNNTEFQVIYGKANRIEKYDGENWVEVTTESVGIFPATTVTLQPEDEMYGMCGWVSKKLILDAGTYRYLLVVEVQGTEVVGHISEWKQEYADLKAQRDTDYTKLKAARAEVAELQKIRKCVDIALKAEQPEQTQNRTKRHEQER